LLHEEKEEFEPTCTPISIFIGSDWTRKKIQMGMEKLLIYRGVHQLIKPRSSQDGAFLFEQKPVARRNFEENPHAQVVRHSCKLVHLQMTSLRMCQDLEFVSNKKNHRNLSGQN
jgi:hypothetical protein